MSSSGFDPRSKSSAGDGANRDFTNRNFTNRACADFVAQAERELSAFFRAVRELFGAEEAEFSAEDWLHELKQSDGLPVSAREWRSITTKVSTRLAGRVPRSSFLTDLLTEAQSV